jgi:hypothetical protein
MKIFSIILVLAFVLSSAPSFCQTLSVCYHANCFKNKTFEVSSNTRNQVSAFFSSVTSAADEREAIRYAVRELYFEAAKYSPIASDRGGNFSDMGVDGRMDCVDHSRNDTNFLTYFQQQGWLHYHRVGEIVWRNPQIINLHYASQVLNINTGASWIIDTWFLDFGELAVVMPYEQWKSGYSP